MAAPKCRTDYRLESEPLHECGEPPDALIHLDKSVPGHHAFNSAHPVDDSETVLPYYEYKRKQGIVARALFSEEFPMEKLEEQHPFVVDKFYDRAATAMNALGIKPGK